MSKINSISFCIFCSCGFYRTFVGLIVFFILIYVFIILIVYLNLFCSHFDSIRSLYFHPTEAALITASEDHSLKLWNLQKTVPQKK